MIINDLYHFQTSKITKRTVTVRSVQILLSYKANLTKGTSCLPLWGVGTTETSHKFMVPLCLKRMLIKGHHLGDVADNSCEQILTLNSSSNYANFQVIQVPRFTNPCIFLCGIL
jgi:hypothetical protein